MENRIVTTPTIKNKVWEGPTFLHFFILMWRAFWQLPTSQRTHVGAASLAICLGVGLLSMMAMDKVASVELPKHKQTVTTPANLTVEVSEPPPTIFSENVEEPVVVPDDSQFIPKSEEEQPLSPKAKKNKAFPVGVKELIPSSSQDYIKRYAKIAQQEMREYGIPASISLAQGLIESRAGTSKLAVSNNNHFGMKCFSKNCKKGHCSNFTDDTHKDFFRKFPSAWESWRAHSQLLASGRYTKLKRHGRDYRAWAYGLKSCGYATDRTYAEKLIGIIERYDLHKYDR